MFKKMIYNSLMVFDFKSSNLDFTLIHYKSCFLVILINVRFIIHLQAYMEISFKNVVNKLTESLSLSQRFLTRDSNRSEIIKRIISRR